MLHSVFDGGAAEVWRCDCREFGEQAAEFVLGRGDGIQRSVVCAHGEGAGAEAYGGERLRVDEAAAADVHEKAGVVEKVCAEERALDLMRPQR